MHGAKRVNSLLPKIEEICQLVKLVNVFAIGVSETKLHGSGLNKETITESQNHL